MARVAAARRTRAEAKADTRKRLLEAARAEFLRAGFHGTTLERIADRAGFTKGAVYASFASKADLFLALYEERVEQRARSLSQLAAQVDRADRLRTRRMVWADILRRDRAWHLALVEFWAYAARHDPVRRRFAALQGRVRTMMAQAMAQLGLSDGSPGQVDPMLRARAQAALGNGFMLEAFSTPELLTGDTYERLAEALDRGLEVMVVSEPPADGETT